MVRAGEAIVVEGEVDEAALLQVTGAHKVEQVGIVQSRPRLEARPTPTATSEVGTAAGADAQLLPRRALCGETEQHFTTVQEAAQGWEAVLAFSASFQLHPSPMLQLVHDYPSLQVGKQIG